MDRGRYSFGPFVLDADRAVLTRGGAPMIVGGRALALLRVLLEAGNRVVGKADLVDAAWHDEAREESKLSRAGVRALLRMPDNSPFAKRHQLQVPQHFLAS